MKQQQAEFMTLDDIKRMTFLKYAGKLGLGGSIGDPLTNPEFLEIFRFLKGTYPHLALRVITNGIGLNRLICEEFAGSLTRLRISVNAATRGTWEKIMRVQGFDEICTTVAILKEAKKNKKVHQPEIILQMVLHQENIQEAVQFVELASALGVQGVSFTHFMPYSMPECSMASHMSLYYQPESYDRWMFLAEKRATELGIRIMDRPPDFKRRDVVIYEGIREMKSPRRCYAPWYQCFLVQGRLHQERQMQFCCIGVDTEIHFNNNELAEASFTRLWNHDLIKCVRETINSAHKSEVCLACRSIDVADPQYGCGSLGTWPDRKSDYIEAVDS